MSLYTAFMRVSGIAVMTFLMLLAVPAQAADNAAQNASSFKVMEAFERQAEQLNREKELNDKQKHLVMFIIGAPLLILLLVTASLGIAMGIYGKPVFMLHMIFAGLTITLSLVHVIFGLVWFYPF
ncbi:MAG: hypothetical protein V4443_03730 [Pseudomonadota bacterium]